MSDNYKEWKKFRDGSVENIDILTDRGYDVDDLQSVTLVPTLMQIAKSLAVIADELSDINQKMGIKW